MLVSCLCPTYGGRLHLLEEAVESFLRQQLPEGAAAEMVVLNDCPEQRLTFDYDWLWDRPERARKHVSVVNVPRRFRSLGEKRNALVGLARGDVLLPWDDDDISLPSRISDAADCISRGCEYWKPETYLFCERPGAPVVRPGSVGYCHNCSAYTRPAFHAVGGYPPTSGDEDAIMDRKLRRTVVTEQSGGPSYVYRWGVSPHHLSGVRDCNAHYEAIGGLEQTAGRFIVRPRWTRNWSKEAGLCSGATA